ncbi:MAG: hypothetical protein KH452_07215 [Clostridiales bacterium]|nr:hypothetical protein [Clostridiales bacterium]
MRFFQKLRSLWRKDKRTEEIVVREEKKSFLIYIGKASEVLTWFRRERGISKRDLELVLIDNEEQQAYQILRITELLMADLNVLYVVTQRPEEFTELEEEAMREHGLLIMTVEAVPVLDTPGELVLDLHEWEKHLDIISGVSYNTMIS